MKFGNAVALDMIKLDEVVGGLDREYGDGYTGWANSSRFMNDIFDGSVCQRYGDWRACRNTDEIKSAWRRVGVEVCSVSKVVRFNTETRTNVYSIHFYSWCC